MMTGCLLLATILCLLGGMTEAAAQLDQELPVERGYRPGDQYAYSLRTIERHNGREGSLTLARSQHTVVESGGKLGEEIRWQNVQVIFNRDTLLFDSLAHAQPPYFISLAGDGSVELPPLQTPQLVGPITDLNTFFVSVHPSEGIAGLKRIGDFFADTTVVQGDFADSIVVLHGKDCLTATYRLIRMDEDEVEYEVAFTPSSRSCLSFAHDDLNVPVVDGTPNNFQMIRVAGEEKVNLMWGAEDFTVKATVQRSTGMILRADMRNTLRLKLRINCDPDLKAWQFEMPFTIERESELKLVR